MKLTKKEEMVKSRLWDIAYINNLDSTDIKESVNQIVEKGLELELLVEFNFLIDIEELKNMLNRIAFYNHIQRRYQLEVEMELNKLV
jgi:hypothetical protein